MPVERFLRSRHRISSARGARVQIIHRVPDFFETRSRRLGSNRKERQSLMLSGRYSQHLQVSKTRAVRYHSAWILCGLLLLFCVNAGAARYGVRNRNLKSATSQSFLASDEARLEAAIAALLLMGCVAILRVPRLITTASSTVAIPASRPSEPPEYDPESHLRPPPLAHDNFA